MPTTAEHLYQEALSLPLEARADLTERLVAALAEEIPSEITRAQLALRCFLWITESVRFSHLIALRYAVQGRIRHKRPPPHFVGPLHLFRFSLEQASLRAGKVTCLLR